MMLSEWSINYHYAMGSANTDAASPGACGNPPALAAGECHLGMGRTIPPFRSLLHIWPMPKNPNVSGMTAKMDAWVKWWAYTVPSVIGIHASRGMESASSRPAYCQVCHETTLACCYFIHADLGFCCKLG